MVQVLMDSSIKESTVVCSPECCSISAPSSPSCVSLLALLAGCNTFSQASEKLELNVSHLATWYSAGALSSVHTLCCSPCEAVLPSTLSANALLTDTSGSPLVLQAERATKNHSKSRSELLYPLQTACSENGHLNISSIESNWGICVSFKHLEFLLWQIRFTF